MAKVDYGVTLEYDATWLLINKDFCLNMNLEIAERICDCDSYIEELSQKIVSAGYEQLAKRLEDGSISKEALSKAVVFDEKNVTATALEFYSVLYEVSFQIDLDVLLEQSS